MTARLIDGKAIAQQVRAEVREHVTAWVQSGGRRPGLATVLVGDDPASAVYVNGKQKASAEAGIEGFSHMLAADVSEQQVIELLSELNGDDRVSGILLQLPTPDHIDGSRLTTLIDAGKDVDGLTPVSAGLLAKGLPGLRAVHAGGRDRAVASPRRRDGGGPRRWSSVARISSASPSRRCCWPRTRPSPSVTRARGTSATCAGGRTS